MCSAASFCCGVPRIVFSILILYATQYSLNLPSMYFSPLSDLKHFTFKPVSVSTMAFYFLKVFCCVSYVHIDFVAHSKLDAKSKICFFIGCGDEKFGYRFWDEQNKKIIRSRNVIFNE